MNRLKRDKQIAVISLLCEGCSIRSASRLTGVHGYTIGQLLLKVGTHCQQILDKRIQGVEADELQLDEVWTFVACKDKRVRPDDPMAHEKGSQYVYTALDPVTKLLVTHLVGRRNTENTMLFLADVASRIVGKVQITTDAFGAYPMAVRSAFNGRASYGMVIKTYAGGGFDEDHKYSPPRVTSIQRRGLWGYPRLTRISTSLVERNNGTLRTFQRRFVRLCNGFSKRLPHLKASVALFMVWYNFCWIPRTSGLTPAQMAMITGDIWKVDRLVPSN